MLHPEAEGLLIAASKSGVPPINELGPVAAREAYRATRTATQGPTPEVQVVRDLTIPGPAGDLPLREYRPADGILGALVYYHGGGFVIGDLDSHDNLCRHLALESGCVVYSVDYRLAPEDRYPAAVDDCIAATQWIYAHADELAIDAARIAIGGDSAGGTLATVTAIALRDAGGPAPVFQLLLYPGTDLRRTTPSHKENAQGYMLTADLIDYFMDHYLDREQYGEWQAAPIHTPDLSGLPPALVITAGYDPLRDDGLAYADALSAAGVETAYVCFDRMIHGFFTMDGRLSEAQVAIDLCASQLRRHLA